MQKDFFELDNGVLHLSIAADATEISVKSSFLTWHSPVPVMFTYGRAVSFNPVIGGKVSMSKDGDKIHFTINNLIWEARFPGHGYLKPDPAPEISLGFQIYLDGDEVVFVTESPSMPDEENIQICFPFEPISFSTGEKGLFAGAWDTLGTCIFFPSAEKYTNENNGILPVAGWLGAAGGVGIRTTSETDYRFSMNFNCTPSQGKCSVVHDFNRNKSEYERTCRLKLFPAGCSYVDLAKWHRKSVIKENRFKSLKSKISETPEVGKLPGSVIWKHNTFAVPVPEHIPKQYPLYVTTRDAAEAEGKKNNWNAKELFDTAYQSGFDRVCVFNTGWNSKGFDSGYPTRFPPNPERGTEDDFIDAANYARTLSKDYIFGVHDNYKDIYANSEEFSIAETVHTIENVPQKGGLWRGGRAYIICGSETLKYAKRDLPHIGRMCGRGAIYLDVQGHTAFRDCYHPDHPGNQRDDAAWRIETFHEAKKHIGAVATEGAPHEFAIPHIDLGAYPALKRCPLSNMKPIPFFQLVYHDSVMNFCDQGVSGVYGKEYYNRVALYCMLPGDFSSESLKISKELRACCLEEMMIHEFLAENLEHTVFADGTEVFANFGNTCEQQIPPYSFVIRKLEKH